MLKLDEHVEQMDHAYWLADVAREQGSRDYDRRCHEYDAEIRAAKSRMNAILRRHGLRVVEGIPYRQPQED